MRSNVVRSEFNPVSSPLRLTRAEDLQRQLEKMFRRLRVSVIYAGNKATDGAVLQPVSNARSWKSYEAVARDIGRSLERLGVREVSVIPEDMNLGRALKENDSHMAWLNSGGVQGYCSVAHGPAMLEMFGIPYVGHDPLMASMLDSKHIFKRQLVAARLPTAPFMVWHPAHSEADPCNDPDFKAVFNKNERDFVVKPVSGRASLNVTFVSDPRALKQKVEEVYELTGNHVLIEKFVSGREFCVAVAGPVVSRGRTIERLAEPFTFAILERVLEPGEHIFTSMDIKPITKDRARPVDKMAEPELYARLAELGRKVFLKIGIEALIRLDIRADAAGNLYVLEANPKPDLKAPIGTTTSLICIGLEEEKMDYDDLIYSQIAHRVDTLFAQQRGTAQRLKSLI
ncbi:MAG: hypothetical protein KGQ46_03280 [Hyphomicrobiales bacterium]|nr:hypothetical protein [Hyphomicrobiales bacterium]MDE2114675.1 hypothetical protein [Hyphomicrobiales bacterium]